jgi:hypothetical protein
MLRWCPQQNANENEQRKYRAGQSDTGRADNNATSGNHETDKHQSERNILLRSPVTGMRVIVHAQRVPF